MWNALIEYGIVCAIFADSNALIKLICKVFSYQRKFCALHAVLYYTNEKQLLQLDDAKVISVCIVHSPAMFLLHY